MDVSDIVLSLQYKAKDACKLTLRVIESSTTALSRAMDPLPEVAAQLARPGPLGTFISGASATVSIATSAPSGLVGPLETLLGSLQTVVKIGDEIAKVSKYRTLSHTALNVSQIHPWASLAWSVLSAIPKVSRLPFDGMRFLIASGSW